MPCLGRSQISIGFVRILSILWHHFVSTGKIFRLAITLSLPVCAEPSADESTLLPCQQLPDNFLVAKPGQLRFLQWTLTVISGAGSTS